MLIWTESFTPIFSSSQTTIIKKSLAGSTLSGGNTSNNWRTGPSNDVRASGGLIVSNSSTPSATLTLAGADQDSRLIAGFASWWATSATPTVEERIVQFASDAGATTHVTVTIGTDRKMRAYRGDYTGTLLATSANPVVATGVGSLTFYYFEFDVTLDDTTGSVTLRVDESNVVTFSGDTKNAGTLTVFDTIQIYGGSPVTTTAKWSQAVDDFYVCNAQGGTNNSFLGAVRIVPLDLTGNGATSNGVNSVGNSTNNYTYVNGVYNNTQGSWSSSYVDLQNTGDKDTYAFRDVSFIAPTISTSNIVYGVSVVTTAQKTDAATRNCKAIARLSGTEVDSPEMSLVNGNDQTQLVMYETKPGGGSWTVADVNAAEFGVKAT